MIPLNVGNGGLTDVEFRIPPNVSIAVKFVVPHPEVPVQGGVVIIPDRVMGLNLNDVCQASSACSINNVPPGTAKFRSSSG